MMEKRVAVPCVVAALLLAGFACDLSPAEEIAGNIDTSEGTCASDTLVVTVQLDVNDGACNEQCSLREAVIAANTCAGQQTIEVPDGTHTLRLRGEGDVLGDLDITDNVVIRGESRDGTIIEGISSWDDRIFDISEDGTVEMSDLTIQGGNSPDEGGGIRNGGYLTLHTIRFASNSADRGGALFNGNRAMLDQVEFAGNSATASGTTTPGRFNDRWPADYSATTSCGGAIANQGYARIEGGTIAGNRAWAGAGLCNIDDPVGAQIFGVDFADNRASEFGGGIANFGRMEVHGSHLLGNEAAYGGGVYSMPPESGYMEMYDVEIGENSADAGAGVFQAADTLLMRDSVIRDQRFTQSGGGISVRVPSDDFLGDGTHIAPRAVIERTAIVRNMNDSTASAGFASAVHVGYRGVVEMENVTISGNQSGNPGALFVMPESHAYLKHVTIAENRSSEQGGGILNGGTVEIAAHNTFSNCKNGPDALMISRGYNIQEGNLCGFDNPADLTLSPGSTAVSTLLDYGLTELGGSFVHLVPPSSAAFDLIPPEDCALAEDQLSAPRPAGDGCESGAYEADLTAMSAQPTLELAAATATPAEQPSQPTVATDTLCWKGPGGQYEVVSSLKTATEVQILGRGVEGDWWVLDNPRYPGVPCWAPGGDIEVQPNYEYPSTLFEIPPLPTPTATEPVLGCLYQGPNDQQAACYPIDQCPVDLGDSQGACTP
jgi:CSLREA domain-containing protein